MQTIWTFTWDVRVWCLSLSQTGLESSNLLSFSCLPGPSQNPVELQPPGPGYMAHQTPYNPMQAKGPMPPGPGLYNSGPYQPIPPVSSNQALPGQPMLKRPPMGPQHSMTPPQSASPGPGSRMPPAHATPPPVSANNYQHPPAPAWQYGGTPPMGAPPSMGAPPPMAMPPLRPVGNHMTFSPSLATPQASSGEYSAAPPVFHNASQPLGPPTSLQGYTQQGKTQCWREQYKGCMINTYCYIFHSCLFLQ